MSNLTKEEIKDFREKFEGANNSADSAWSSLAIEAILSYLSEKKKQWQKEVKEKYEPIIIRCNCDDCREELSKEGGNK